MTFEDFDLDPRCLSVLKTMDIVTPTPVQAQAIPVALEGRDLIGIAQTGTGKTLGFALPSLSRLAQEKNRRNRMLILLPTRELCAQVESVVNALARALKLRSVLIYGGVSYRPQTSRLHSGCDIVVATPGRLLDHMGRGNVRFSDLEILVFDEGDRMLDMGFLPDIRRILARLPKKRQTMMFSATMPDEIDRLAQQILQDPERIAVGQIHKPVDTVRQVIYAVRQEDKSRLLAKLLNDMEIDSAIVFLRTKQRTDRLGMTLKKAGHKAVAIHGDLSQGQRQRALDGFKTRKYTILVATDVAARGLDIEDISHVVNYDIPPTSDDYIHRIGRTARAERDGDAITFVTPTDFSALEVIERALGHNIEREDYEGAPPLLTLYGAKPPARRGRGRRMLRRR